MGSPIWKEARRRAWGDVLDILRLKPRRRAVVTLGLVVVVAAASWTFTGVVAVTAAASAAWLVVAGIGLYVWGLITSTAKIAAEKQQELDALAALPAIPKYALLITADAESDFTDANKVTLNLRVKNTTPTALAVASILGYYKINSAGEIPIKCSGYLLHGNGAQCSYQFDLGESLREPRDGAIQMAVKLAFGLPDQVPSRTVDQALTVTYQYRGAVTYTRCTTTASAETEA